MDNNSLLRHPSVNQRNRIGRTRLFYAILKDCNDSAQKLKDARANLYVTDNFGVSVLRYFLYDCINNKSDVLRIQKKTSFFKENGFENQAIFREIINAVFCKIPLCFWCSEGRSVSMVLEIAFDFITDVKERKMLQEIANIANSTSMCDLPEVLKLLSDLGADSNTADENGNIVLHNITQALLGISNMSDISEVCSKLSLDSMGYKENGNNEKPLLFLMSCALRLAKEKNSGIRQMVEICGFLLNHQACSLNEKSQNGMSVFHLIMKLFQAGLNVQDQEDYQNDLLEETVKLLKLFSKKINNCDFESTIINKGDDEQMNTPLHCWATLSVQDISKDSKETCRSLLRIIFDQLLICGARLNVINLNGQTPLHISIDWYVFKRLVDAKANVKIIDVDGRTPLCVAAHNGLFLQNFDCFHTPDATEDPTRNFWKYVISKGFDIWANDKYGHSLISYLNDLIEPEAFGELTTALVDVAYSHNQLDKALKCVQHARISKCTSTTLKDLEEMIKKLGRKPIKAWHRCSKTHKDKLAVVAKGEKCCTINNHWYHPDPIASGQFGHVFVGIDENSGNEVAIKRIKQSLIVQPPGADDIISLATFTNCIEIVKYQAFFTYEDPEDPLHVVYLHVVMEMMEGNLYDYLKSDSYVQTKNTDHFESLTKGLVYLHHLKIFHGNLKPANILYSAHPLPVSLKIGDFGFSCRLDTSHSKALKIREWMAPELNVGDLPTESSDVFALGLIIHYIYTRHHPFNPDLADCSRMSSLEISETVKNIRKNDTTGWDNSLPSEVTNLLESMLHKDRKNRPSASKILDHPTFWSDKKKMDFLKAVGDQWQFGQLRAQIKRPLTLLEKELDGKPTFSTIVEFGTWNDAKYTQTSKIYAETIKIATSKKERTTYDTCSIVELTRFTRNVIEHPPSLFVDQIISKYVFLNEFPNLVIEVYKAVMKYGWGSKKKIKEVLKNK